MLYNLIRTMILGLLFHSTFLFAAPQAFQASYAVEKSGVTLGEMKASLSYSGQQYTYSKQTKANGLAALLSGDTLTERSTGTNAGQLTSKSYLNHHKNKRKDRRDQFNFTAPTQVQGSYKDKSYQLAVPQNTVDPALLELRIMEDIAANRPLNYHITEKGKIRQYRFQRQGKETLTLPIGQYTCEKIHMVRDNGKRITTIWLIPELDYIPARIRHSDEGDVIETALQSYQAR